MLVHNYIVTQINIKCKFWNNEPITSKNVINKNLVRVTKISYELKN